MRTKANLSPQQADQEWEKFRKSIIASTPAEVGEKTHRRKERVAELEKNHEAWFRYYFPKFFRYPSPAFHADCSKAFIENPNAYDIWSWARGLAKTTRARMCWTKLGLTGECHMLLAISDTQGNCINKLTKSMKIQLESNPRIINDYGKQQSFGNWKEEEFTTIGGFKVASIGAGNQPRGANNEDYRPDGIWGDDLDTDEECRNPERVRLKVKWVNEAVFPTMDIAEKKRRLFCGNIIAEYCTITELAKKAKSHSIINIRDEDGNSVWPEKNTEAAIAEFLGELSYEAVQKEYYNNPINEGATFTEMKWGKCPPMESLEHLVLYSDPATSNKDKPKGKSTAQNSCKGTMALGYKGGNYYLYKCFLDNMNTAKYIDCLYAMRDYVGGRKTHASYIENNSLQQPFYEQVILPKISEYARDKGVLPLLIKPDERPKDDKYTRIEAHLEPLNRLGKLILNEEEKNDPHMQRMEVQFKSVSPNSKTMDGPDMVEGGFFKIREKIARSLPTGGTKIYKRKPSSKRF